MAPTQGFDQDVTTPLLLASADDAFTPVTEPIRMAQVESTPFDAWTDPTPHSPSMGAWLAGVVAFASLHTTDNPSSTALSVVDTHNVAAQAPAVAAIDPYVDGGVVRTPIANLDVRSPFVLTFAHADQVKFNPNGTHQIVFKNTGGAGYGGENSDHTQTLTFSNGVVVDGGQVTIHQNQVFIDLACDLDLANNYEISFDNGAFLNEADQPIAGLSATSSTYPALTFSTVTPATTHDGADGFSVRFDAASGVLQTNTFWLDLIAHQGDTSGATPTTLLGTTPAGPGLLGDPHYVYVLPDVTRNAPNDVAAGLLASGDVVTPNFWVQFQEFGVDDLVYVDDQANGATPHGFIYAPDPFTLNDSDGVALHFNTVSGPGKMEFISLQDSTAQIGYLSYSGPMGIGKTANLSELSDLMYTDVIIMG